MRKAATKTAVLAEMLDASRAADAQGPFFPARRLTTYRPAVVLGCFCWSRCRMRFVDRTLKHDQGAEWSIRCFNAERFSEGMVVVFFVIFAGGHKHNTISKIRDT